ncbi:MAG: AAA family ATPase, partial [Byssovorax sp.]
MKLELQSAAKAKTEDRQANWNVILGENGDGKTSLLQGIAACLMDATTADRMLRPDGWVRRGAKYGALDATLVPEQNDSVDMLNGTADVPRRVAYRLVKLGPTESLVRPSEDHKDLYPEDFGRLVEDSDYLYKYAFGGSKPSVGWFSAGYGPFRRPSIDLGEGRSLTERRFSTLFNEGAPIVDCESWLLEMDRQALRRHGKADGQEAAQTLASCKSALVALLPDIKDVRVEEGVRFISKDGKEQSLDQLSHGYRSVFALAVDILRWARASMTNWKKQLHEARGVVLVDEIDTHLHPTWQRQVGFMLCQTFPNLQFIVTSHSPFVAMAAAPGGLTVLKRNPADGTVTAHQDMPDIRGWAAGRVLTELFDMESLHDPRTETKLARYEELRTRIRSG